MRLWELLTEPALHALLTISANYCIIYLTLLLFFREVYDMKLPELLCPAGNPEKLRAAIDYGADAVYFAGNVFGMRAAADNFTTEEIKAGADYAHRYGGKAYLTVNVMPHENEYPELYDYIDEIKDTGIDAAIVADLGVISLFREKAPHIPLHISTQANVVSSAACRAYAALGAERIVLARELTLSEIKKIKSEIPDGLELETFIHGSMCISNSGRCLISNHFTGRDANRGMCAQPCRWEYRIAEVKRPDDILTVEEDTLTGESFIMSSKDLCMIEHIPELVLSGIDSLKIEGRMKSAYYTAVVANTYRMALDRYARDPESYVCDPEWLRELSSVSHREYATGFYFDRPGEEAQTVTEGGYIREKAYLAVASTDSDSSGIATFVQRNKFSVGDTAEVISPGRCGRPFTVTEMYDDKGEPIVSAPHPQMSVGVKVPFEIKAGDILRQN